MTNHSSAKLLQTTTGQSVTATTSSINSLLISAMSNLTSSAASSMMNGLGTSTLVGALDPNGAIDSGGGGGDGGGGSGGNSAVAAVAAAATASNVAELIICKLVTPYHIINDPRMLECGHSACANCIVSIGKQAGGSPVKCPYCQQMHKLPVDVNKLITNKNLQTFLKFNLAQINQNFTKQLEDSMLVLERKLSIDMFCCCFRNCIF